MLDDGEGERVIGPFKRGLCFNGCSIFEPGVDPASNLTVAEWVYGEGDLEGWEAQRHRDGLEGLVFPVALIRGVIPKRDA